MFDHVEIEIWEARNIEQRIEAQKVGEIGGICGISIEKGNRECDGELVNEGVLDGLVHECEFTGNAKGIQHKKESVSEPSENRGDDGSAILGEHVEGVADNFGERPREDHAGEEGRVASGFKRASDKDEGHTRRDLRKSGEKRRWNNVESSMEDLEDSSILEDRQNLPDVGPEIKL